MVAPLEVFCCYAREDQEMLILLKKHLAPLRRQGQITIWSDTNLNAGVQWKREVHQHLESADIILLLISPDFMASEYCYNIEMERAIERDYDGNAKVIPILLRSTFWENAPFAKLQMVPTNAKPVTNWPDRDDAFHDITMQVKRVVSELHNHRALPVEGGAPQSGNGPFHPVPLPSSLPKIPPPVPVSLHRPRRSVCSLALFLIGLAVIVIIGSIGLVTMTTQNFTRNVNATMTAHTIVGETATVRALPTVAAAAYNHTVAANGIMSGFDAQHTGYNPFERILSPATVSGLKTAWTSDPTGNRIYSSPAVANGVVYVGSWDHKLYAYKAEGCGSGKSTCPPLWSSDPTGGSIDSSPAVANGVVYVGSFDDKLYAYKAEGCGSGKSTCPPLWSSDPTGDRIFTSSPAVANGVVYVGSVNHKLYAYKAEGCGSGKSTCPLWSSDPTGDRIFTSSPAVANGVVYVGSINHKLYAYKAEGCGSGKSTCPPLWSSDSAGDYISSSPAVANGVVYVGSYDRKLYAYKAEGCGSGKSTCPPLWSSDSAGDSITSSPAVANGVVYVGSINHKLYAYKAEGCGSGKSTCPLLWSSDPTGGGIFSSPAVANGVVYVGSYDRKLYAFHLYM